MHKYVQYYFVGLNFLSTSVGNFCDFRKLIFLIISKLKILAWLFDFDEYSLVLRFYNSILSQQAQLLR